MRKRFVAVGTTTLVVLGAVVGAVAASPGAEVELRATSAAATETEKYLGTWTELQPNNMPGDATGSLRLIGTEKDPAKKSASDKLTGKVDFGGEEFCPADIDAAATKAVETIKEKSKNFDPDGKGQKDGYNPKGEGEVTDSSEAAGDFRAVVENEKHDGEKFKEVSVEGTDPACAVGASGTKAGAQRASLEELIYLLEALFASFRHRDGDAGAARDEGLGDRFSGMLTAESPELGEDVRIAVQADLIP